MQPQSPPETPFGRTLPRRAERALNAALLDTRVVLVNGARQSGKSTIVRKIAGARDQVTIRDLESSQIRAAAIEDPAAFIEHDGLMVIDEIQLVPELMSAIKADVDARFRPGRYLLTGSARVLALRTLPDALPGRMETVELWPFSQGEIDGAADGFIDAAFQHGERLRHDADLTRADYASRIVRGGFPEAVARENPVRRRRFLRDYVQTLVDREVIEISQIERVDEMRAMLGLLAARTGQLLVVGDVARDAGLPYNTTRRYLSLLDEVFLIKRVPAWSTNLTTRAIDTPKLAFVDSGIAASLLGMNPQALLEPGNAAFGPLLESFALMELGRQLTWSNEEARLFHYRTKDKVEVDAVLENDRGLVVGIEVKATLTVRAADFRGLRHLADRLGPRFVAGLVLYAGKETLPFGPRMRALPLSSIWEVAP